MGKAFKLQSVLNYRQIIERKAQQVLARALTRQGDLMAQLARQRAELDYLTSDFENRKRQGLSMADLNLYRSHIRYSEQQLRSLEKEFEQSNAEVCKCREELMRSCQDRRMVEKLKQKQAVQTRRENLHRENLSLDEIALRERQGGLA
ncbi:flagellar export protein FliJ [Geothermobacter hydrogeniphilus]|uniref:Flagellar FliJ protein n=1 Tax=Geothermobacter hydrogeniphilus TaxID=1969733 RepID=A0A1X0YEJ9_9BACT|nr:flagellar export protein FliJ [Geothermobacter hydrogeniphilus]ORJ63522.1 flagellar export protein FliJ [Geothermobacter hydrogeniphilus]